MKCSISIWGTCILRDIFGMHDNDGDYQIEHFVQDVNPISAISKSMLLKEINVDEIKEIYHDVRNFSRRNAILDLQKKVFFIFLESKF